MAEKAEDGSCLDHGRLSAHLPLSRSELPLTRSPPAGHSRSFSVFRVLIPGVSSTLSVPFPPLVEAGGHWQSSQAHHHHLPPLPAPSGRA